jgi:hypothetical protein
MEIISVLKQRMYLAIAVAAAAAMAVAYPFLQTITNFENIDVWLHSAPVENFVFYPLYSVLFGALVALQAYRIRGPKVCSIKKGGAATTLGTALALLVGQCPACVSLASFVLPAGAVLFIAKNTLVFNIIATGLLLLGILMLGGFRRRRP